MRNFAYDSMWWRRLAHLGASRFPEWWVRYSPPFFGLAAAALVPSARKAVAHNVRRVRGDKTALRDAIDVGRTFTTYASCLAEVLSNGSKNAREPETLIYGVRNAADVFAKGEGCIIATAHTAGWEIVGPLLGRDHKMSLMMVMERERDERAQALHDEARRQAGVEIVHVGGDPLAALPLLRHLKTGGVVALQIDRVAQGMKTRTVRLFGGDATLPEGPFRLAQASGAPIVTIFSARRGYRKYTLYVSPPIYVGRHATEAEIDADAQRVADSLASFLRENPSQWFRFQPA